jgi:hypothetical protein
LGFEELHSEFFQVAAALHPQFKLRWVAGSDREDVKFKVQQALDCLEDASTCNISTMPSDASDNIDSMTELDVEAVSEERQSFFWRYEQPDISNTSVSSPQSQYKVWCRWVETWDKKIPEILINAYIRYNTTLPSSASVERLFSLSKRVLSPNRNLLGDDSFEWCVFLPALERSGV